jgi:hypothetical protein
MRLYGKYIEIYIHDIYSLLLFFSLLRAPRCERQAVMGRREWRAYTGKRSIGRAIMMMMMMMMMIMMMMMMMMIIRSKRKQNVNNN